MYEVSRRAWGLRLRRNNKGSRYRPCPCCLPHMLTASASGLYIFAAQSPTPPIPLFTLRRAPRDAQRKTRGQSGSLLLLCKASSSSASYRFNPAHKHPDSAHPMREDVKQKHFSTPLRETSIRCLHPGPFFFLRGEGFGSNPWSATEYDRDTDRSCWSPLSGFMQRS